MLRLLPLLSLAIALPLLPSEKSSAGSLSDFDDGLQFKFAIVRTNAGDEYTGQIIGVYNEAHFMWNPTPYSTLALFVCSDPTVKLGHFSVQPGSDPGIFSISSADISTITLVGQPDSLVEYQHYMRINGYVWSVTPVEGEIWISRDWTGYHAWEDGRGNYAWDIGALNTNMMSYSGLGRLNTNYAVWGKNVQLPMAGTVVTAVEKEVDNSPDMDAAVDLEDNVGGEGVELEELPQNLIELRVGGTNSPFLLRLIHLMQNSIPNGITVGNHYPAGTVVGTVGNSGTTLVPHLHSVWGFTDANNRYWALPIEWQSVAHRILMAYPAGYQYGQYHHHDYLYPKYGWCITN